MLLGYVVAHLHELRIHPAENPMCRPYDGTHHLVDKLGMLLDQLFERLAVQRNQFAAREVPREATPA